MLLFLMLAAATADFPPDPKLDAVIAFGNSTSYPLQAKTCKKLLPELSDDFDASLKQWQKDNKAQIKAGREIIVREGMHTGVDTVRMIRDNQVWLDEQFRAGPTDKQISRCHQLLVEIRRE